MARILIIEDNQDIHALIKQSLGQEHELVSAFAGTEGFTASPSRWIWSCWTICCRA